MQGIFSSIAFFIFDISQDDFFPLSNKIFLSVCSEGFERCNL